MGQTLTADPQALSAPVDGRRHRRVAVALTGRCMFEDRSEVACRIVDMSVGGAAVTASFTGVVKERVVAYVDQIGRIEGRIVRHLAGGFAFAYSVSQSRRDKLADQLTWIANLPLLGLAEVRRHVRVVPADPWSTLVMRDGSVQRCRVLDVSMSGAAVRATVRPPIGAPVLLGRTRGKVVRLGRDDIGIEFADTKTDGLTTRAVA